MAEQTIEAMGFPIECRFPNCKHTATEAEMEVHKEECEHRLRECRWCNERVAFDTHEDHERRCHHDAWSRHQEEEHDRRLQLHREEVEQANRVIRRTRREQAIRRFGIEPDHAYANLVDRYLSGRHHWGAWLEAPQNQHQPREANLVDPYLAGIHRWGLEASQNQPEPREVEQEQLGQPERMHHVQDAVHPEHDEAAEYDDEEEDEIYLADHVQLNWEHGSYASSLHSNSTNLTFSRMSDMSGTPTLQDIQDEFFPNE